MLMRAAQIHDPSGSGQTLKRRADRNAAKVTKCGAEPDTFTNSSAAQFLDYLTAWVIAPTSSGSRSPRVRAGPDPSQHRVVCHAHGAFER
jgi:hypothetical protein